MWGTHIASVLHLTKVAFGVSSVEELVRRWAARAETGEAYLTTRFLPKRHEEIAGKGSLYWILKHRLVARAAITGFGEAEGGRVAIHLGLPLVLVEARGKRAHQGWRYLAAVDAPADLGNGDASGIGELPPTLINRLAELALI